MFNVCYAWPKNSRELAECRVNVEIWGIIESIHYEFYKVSLPIVIAYAFAMVGQKTPTQEYGLPHNGTLEDGRIIMNYCGFVLVEF